MTRFCSNDGSDHLCHALQKRTRRLALSSPPPRGGCHEPSQRSPSFVFQQFSRSGDGSSASSRADRMKIGHSLMTNRRHAAREHDKDR